MGERMMQALLFVEPAPDTSRTQIAQVPVPTVGPAEVLIEVSHAGINFKDVMLRRGGTGYADAWPIIPGLEVSGIVAGLGAQVKELQVGDQVAALTNLGGLAEYVTADAAVTAPIPDAVPMAAAAVVPGVFASAQLLLHESARVRPGDTIVVHSAAGAVGNAVATLARRIDNVTLLGVVGSTERAERALAAGYDGAFIRGDNLAHDVRTYLGGAGADVVLDPQGTDWLDADLNLLAPGGRIVLFGNAAGGRLAPLPAARRLVGANASVGGFSISALSQTAPAKVGRAISDVLDHIAVGTIKPEYRTFQGLTSAPDLQHELAQGAGATKYVIEIGR